MTSPAVTAELAGGQPRRSTTATSESEDDTPPPSTGNGAPGVQPDDEDPYADPDVEPDIDELCPTFADLTDSNTHDADICALAIDEIVLGFDDGTYRPGNPVPRGQVASVIGRTEGFDLPEVTDSNFTDTAGTTHAAAIEELTTRGITPGSRTSRSDPATSSDVTRLPP